MDPHNCDDFIDDVIAAADCGDKRDRLVDHLTGAWRVKPDGTPWCHGTIRRYDGEEVDGFIYRGWALWERGNSSEPKSATAEPMPDA